jgi:hypothetical protein
MKPTFILQNNQGKYIQSIPDCISFTSSVSVGNTATMSMTTTPDKLRGNLLSNLKDTRLAVLLKSQNFTYLDNIYLLSSWGKGISRITPEVVLNGVGFDDLLSRRIVLGDEDTAIGYKNGRPENIMLEVVRESLGDDSGNPANRSLTSKGLSFAPAVNSSSYTVEATVAWRNVLDVLRDLQQITKDLGNEFFYKITPSLNGKFVFSVTRLAINNRTATSSRPIIIPITSPELTDVEFGYSSDRVVTNAYINFNDSLGSDLVEYTKFQGKPSPLARTEQYEQTSLENTNEWEQIAQRIFAQNRASYTVRGKITESNRFKYGRDWHMGTVFTVMDGARKMNVQVRGVGLEFSVGVLSTYGEMESVEEDYVGIG